jgi:hypothetical protein
LLVFVSVSFFGAVMARNSIDGVVRHAPAPETRVYLQGRPAGSTGTWRRRVLGGRASCAETEHLVKRFIALAVAAVGCALATGAAHAGSNVHWSVGINVPVGAVMSSAPVYVEPAPVYAPGPVVYAPAPVYVAPPPPVYVVPRVVYAPAPVIYRPVPVVAYPYRHRHPLVATYYRDVRWDDPRRHRR